MIRKFLDQLTSGKTTWWWGLAAIISAGLPWWRNHGLIRDFMDYGLVMAGAGRIGDGEAPYVDFITPIQAGFLYLNRGIEVFGGGTFIGMTYGGLALIIGGWLLLKSMLQDFCGKQKATWIAWIIIVCTASQHSIIWHNTLGVICVTAVVWSAAIAPRISLSSWRWSLVMVVGLWVGGMNKVSFQLIAIAGALGFVLRAAILRQMDIRNLTISMGAIVISGVILPIGTELLLTGASFSQWSYNVLQLAGGSRAEYLTELWNGGFYLRPLHDYYGPLPIPQFGLITVFLFGGLFFGHWRDRELPDRILLFAATTGCALCVLFLLATNQEIAYVAAGAAVSLAAAIVLGFKLRLTRIKTGITLTLLTVLFALPALRSAWIGERVLFGHSASSRSDYQELAIKSPEFSYLSGVIIPPESVDSYSILSELISPPNAAGRHRVFYGTGVEWLERVWPSERPKGLPLWLHDGTSYGPPESELLKRFVNIPSRFDQLISSVPRDHWPGRSHVPIKQYATSRLSGSVLKVYQIPQDLKDAGLQLKLINAFKTNFEPRLLEFDELTLLHADEELRPFFGTQSAEMTIKLNWKGSRARAEPILKRTDLNSHATIQARYIIEYVVDGTWHHIWSEDLQLLPGENSKSLQTVFDGRQRELRFRLEWIASTDAVAGWYAPTLLDSQPTSTPPPPLNAGVSPVDPDVAGVAESLIATEWRPDQIHRRGGEIESEGLRLHPGDQIWLKVNEPLSALDGVLQVDGETQKEMPLIRILWYKAGRVQMAWQGTMAKNQRTHHFHAWSAGTNGWIGLMVDPAQDTHSVLVRVDRTDRQN
ncbi:hypothetical protein N9023_06135 [Opitutaceae bacterium]|nr:hypothetical protein [Opitutaceae bacterium]